jgi:hypothetical protein
MKATASLGRKMEAMAETKRNGAKSEGDKARNPVTVAELRRRLICKKRYGRASLTINRWGPRLVGDTELAKLINNYRDRAVSSEEVGWAFVRARVAEQSPTFRWENAELERLIRLVVECSESPKLTATNAGELADELVEQQDREREQFQKAAQSLAGVFSGVQSLAEQVATTPFMPFIANQQEMFVSLSRSVVEPLSAAGRIQDVFRIPDVPAASMAEAFASYPSVQVTVPQFLNAVNTRFALPESYLGAARALEAQLAERQHEAMALTFANLRRRQTVTVSQLIQATQQAAETIADEGAEKEAEALHQVADEAAEVIQFPTEENVAEVLETLVSEVRSVTRRMAALDEKVDANERQRQVDRREDQAFAIYLFFLTLVTSVLVPLFIELLKGMAGF